MSVNVGQIFVRVPDRNALISYIQSYLQTFAKKLGVGFPDGRLIDKDGKRRLLLTPPVRGWSAILEGDFRNTELGLAAMISEHFKARAIGIQVEGCIFNYKWASFENGEQRMGGILLDADATGSACLPLFKDAEKLAWDQAVTLGLPTELLFLRINDFDAIDSSPMPAVLFELSKEDNGFRLQAFEQHVRIPLQPTGIRVLADAALANNAGDPQVIHESRFLWGTPDGKSFENLCMLLRRIQSRYSRSAGLPVNKIQFSVYVSGKPLGLPDDLTAVSAPTSPAAKPNPQRKAFE